MPPWISAAAPKAAPTSKSPLPATNHKTGYVYANQLNPQPHVTSPAAALARQKQHAAKKHSIPVYTCDGHTIIGRFAINSGHSKSSPVS